MRFSLLAFLLAVAPVLFGPPAQADDGPPIVITSPDTATTFAFGSVKDHSLFWDKKSGMLIARIVFDDVDQAGGSANDDTHEFRLPGVSFDPAKGLFYAASAKGERIPVAHIRKELFLKVVETLPNAVVRIQHPHGQVTVILEAVKPDDPFMRPAPPGTNSDTGRSFDLHDLIQ
jgi:hypothetical protein